MEITRDHPQRGLEFLLHLRLNPERSLFSQRKQLDNQRRRSVFCRRCLSISYLRYESRSFRSLLIRLIITSSMSIQILGFLAPRDLLTMAKINKLFRRTLLSSQATTVWKSSRERVGGPACPGDYNEVEWALLLFGIVCQVSVNILSMQRSS